MFDSPTVDLTGLLQVKSSTLLLCLQVIMLSYFNVKEAVDHYVSQGGTAKFIVCDDGFQVRQQSIKLIQNIDL